jgi:hypothetical protein
MWVTSTLVVVASAMGLLVSILHRDDRVQLAEYGLLSYGLIALYNDLIHGRSGVWGAANICLAMAVTLVRSYRRYRVSNGPSGNEGHQNQ